MKPNFALILSSDGIGLLHRSVAGVAEGWNMLGEASLEGDEPGSDLGATLKALREKAAQFDPSGLHCTLVLPNDQIKYITLPRADMSGDDPQQAALDALEGATPYEVAALVVDWSLAKDHLHVAAVARETLTEAENFATHYGFSPVCFTAAPDAGDYTGAPYFGVTSSHDAGDPVEHDKAPVRVTGSAFMPKAVLPDLAETPDKIADKIADTIPATPFTSIRTQSDDLPKAVPTKTPKTPSEPDVSGVTDATLPIEPEPNAPDPLLKAAPPATKPTSFKSSRAPHSTPPKPAKTTPVKATPVKATSALPPAPDSETARMTIFGARDPNKTTHRSGRSWLGLAALVVVSLAGLAALAMMTFDDGLAGLFRRPEQARITDIPDPADPPQTDPQPLEITDLDTTTAPDEAPLTDPPTDVAEGAVDPAVPPPSDDPIDPAVIASLQPADEAPDAITPDAITPETPPPAQQTLTLPDPVELTPDQARARYAATGIWQMAPVGPQAPPAQSLKDLYQAAIDSPVSRPNSRTLPLPGTTDARPLTLLSPPDPGTDFDFDARGLVIATKDGALTPQGVRVYAGKPALVPPEKPGAPAQSAATGNTLDPALLQQTRPRPRPDDLAEQRERSLLGGLTRAELAKLRPKIRPQSAQEAAALAAAGSSSAIDAAVSEAALSNLSVQVVTASPRPTPRPEGFSEIVAQIRAAQQPEVTPGQPVIASAGAVDANAVGIVTPTIPTSASIARAATDENVIKLRKINLIGVYGTPNSRRALVRLPNGRYRKVVIGDRLDGGKVAAIGDNELRYIKRGRNVVLKLPQS